MRPADSCTCATAAAGTRRRWWPWTRRPARWKRWPRTRRRMPSKRSVIRLPTVPRRSRSSINTSRGRCWTIRSRPTSSGSRTATGASSVRSHDRSTIGRGSSPTTGPTARRPITSTTGSRAAWSTCSATDRSSRRRSWRRCTPRSSGRGISSTSWPTTASPWARRGTARIGRPNRCRRSSTSTAARGHGTVGATIPCTSL